MTKKRPYQLTQSQKMMVFILSMSLYGLSNMFTELLPSVQLGPIELSVEYFAFIPLTLCILFHPLYAAIGAALGEVIFGELMLGQFGGIGEIEKFITFSLGMYIAGILVRNPLNRLQVGIGVMSGLIVHHLLGTMVDIGKVWVGIEELEAVQGLAESILIIEGVAFFNDLLFSGILFALLPTLYLVPRLYGKIEPLLGMKPRDNKVSYSLNEIITPKLIVIGVILSAVAVVAEFMSEADLNIGEWEPDFLEMFGSWFVWIIIGVAAIISAITLLTMMKKSRDRTPVLNMAVEPIVQLKDVSFTYPGAESPVLHNIDLTINPGEFTAIVGGNGSGKSTLCKTFNGLIPQFYVGDFEGEVIVNGLLAKDHSVAQLSQNVGYVYQDFENQLLRPTVLDDVCFVPLNYGLADYKERGEWALEVTGLSYHNEFIWQLSGGQKRLLRRSGS